VKNKESFLREVFSKRVHSSKEGHDCLGATPPKWLPGSATGRKHVDEGVKELKVE